MILDEMLARLYRSLANGPGVNARPHSSRQRLDWMDLAPLGMAHAGTALECLLTTGVLDMEFDLPEAPLFGASFAAQDSQAESAEKKETRHTLLRKLRGMESDALDYLNDHGESALAVGLPLLSIPPGDRSTGSVLTGRVCSPIAFIPVEMTLQTRRRGRLTLRARGEGEDLLVANSALFTLLEQESGGELSFGELGELGLPPCEELAELIRRISQGLHIPETAKRDSLTEWATSVWAPCPKTDETPQVPSILPSAILGLFPTQNQGLLRDTRWMRENKASLPAPVSLFIDARALYANAAAQPEDNPPHNEAPIPQGPGEIGLDNLLALPADPCQAWAIERARCAPVLVIHGPPGTGKSQTIANIIVDHVARGQRVLFVCEKRTALDVVLNRLEAVGLGSLCGVIHDPSADRRGFYMKLRATLETLSDVREPPDPSPRMATLDRDIAAARAVLLECVEGLHGRDSEGRSYHDLVGEWMAAQPSCAFVDVHVSDEHALDEVSFGAHEPILEEMFSRAERMGWKNSAWRGWPLVALPALLARPVSYWNGWLDRLHAAALRVDEALLLAPSFCMPGPIVLSKGKPLAESLRALADALEKVHALCAPPVRARYATANPETLHAWMEQARKLHGEAASFLDQALSMDNLGALRQEAPPLTELDRRIEAISRWTHARGLGRLLRPFYASAARQALSSLSLPLDEASAQRGLDRYASVRARVASAEALAEPGRVWLPGDDELARHWEGRAWLGRALSFVLPDAVLASWEPIIRKKLSENEPLPDFIHIVRATASRLECGGSFSDTLDENGCLDDASVSTLKKGVLEYVKLSAVTEAWIQERAALEDAARLGDALRALPAGFSHAAATVMENGVSAVDGVLLMRRAALEQAIRRKLAASPALASLDADRIEAAFHRLRDVQREKRTRVPDLARHVAIRRQRAALLAGTGSRLNAQGAAMKNRLFVRGQRALRLRQMVAMGADIPDGDPLYDLCPVWLASPSTVAQIFPAAPLFDVVVFDEASQCRLEEALPVMLRGRRLVIAGDPKQLPPTRFFESGVNRRYEADAETEEGLFEQRQSETEDVLGAALNLAVEQCYLDVHYRSRHPDLIGFSNRWFYGGRLQAVPGPPHRNRHEHPITLHRVDGVYENRANDMEAERAVELVASLLANSNPPSIGVACFNLNQRDIIIEKLERRANQDESFGRALAAARQLYRTGTFEGLFVKNLENVQGDERDVMIICTTFGRAPDGRFLRNFGVLNRTGGARRLNVLVTRARTAIHVLTSIPQGEYRALPPLPENAEPNGRLLLYAYLAEAEAHGINNDTSGQHSLFEPIDTQPAQRRYGAPLPLDELLARDLWVRHGVKTTHSPCGEGFHIDAVLTQNGRVTVGALVDFSRFQGARDPVAWDLFRSEILQASGWKLVRLWSPGLFRDRERQLAALLDAHNRAAEEQGADT